jgi:hypothetical protein
MHPPKKAQLEERRVSPEVRGEASHSSHRIEAWFISTGGARVSPSMQALPAAHDTGTGASVLPRHHRSVEITDGTAPPQSVSTKAEALRAEIVRITIEFRPVRCLAVSLWQHGHGVNRLLGRDSRSRCARCHLRRAGSAAGSTRRRWPSPSLRPSAQPSRHRRNRLIVPVVLGSFCTDCRCEWMVRESEVFRAKSVLELGTPRRIRVRIPTLSSSQSDSTSEQPCSVVTRWQSTSPVPWHAWPAS